MLYPRGAIPARRVILVGLGKVEDFTLDTLRRAAASAILRARELKVNHAASVLHGEQTGLAAQAISEGSLMALYNYGGQKSNDAPAALPLSLDLVVADEERQRAASAGIRAGMALAAGQTD